MTHQINISFTKENKLKIILNEKLVDSNLKLCFSLVYSIKSITGAEITKQIGRYYELSIKKNTIFLDLQIPKIGKSISKKAAQLPNSPVSPTLAAPPDNSNPSRSLNSSTGVSFPII